MEIMVRRLQWTAWCKRCGKNEYNGTSEAPSRHFQTAGKNQEWKSHREPNRIHTQKILEKTLNLPGLMSKLRDLLISDHPTRAFRLGEDCSNTQFSTIAGIQKKNANVVLLKEKNKFYRNSPWKKYMHQIY